MSRSIESSDDTWNGISEAIPLRYAGCARETFSALWLLRRGEDYSPELARFLAKYLGPSETVFIRDAAALAAMFPELAE